MRSIVIAKYKEDISWVQKIPKGWNIHIYDKDMENFPNAPGREAHTYLHFIYHNYDSLEGDYIFCQGNPFDHCPTFLDELYLGAISGKKYPCTRIDRSMPSDGKALQTAKAIEHLGLVVPENWEFVAGANFKAKAADIKRHPKEFYKKCLDMTLTDPQSGYIFEGLWSFILL